MKKILLLILTLTSLNSFSKETLFESHRTHYTYFNEIRYTTQLRWADLNEKSESEIPPNNLSFYINQAFTFINKNFANDFDDFSHPSINSNVTFHNMINLNDGLKENQEKRWYVVVGATGWKRPTVKSGKKEQSSYQIQVVMDLDGNIFPLVKDPKPKIPVTTRESIERQRSTDKEEKTLNR